MEVVRSVAPLSYLLLPQISIMLHDLVTLNPIFISFDFNSLILKFQSLDLLNSDWI